MTWIVSRRELELEAKTLSKLIADAKAGYPGYNPHHTVFNLKHLEKELAIVRGLIAKMKREKLAGIPRR